MSVIISYYEPATVPGYMEKLFVLFASRLMAKGYTFKLIRKDDCSFVAALSDHKGKYNVFEVTCQNQFVEWRKVL